MAALDYARLRPQLNRARLLVRSLNARRSLIRVSPPSATRCGIHPSARNGLAAPDRHGSITCSPRVQSLNAAELEDFPADHFDVVIVDEFHHAAAPSYERVLNHLVPVELLGLTATPERSDGLPILHWFDDRIAAELRLWDAIDQQYLSPFIYFGIHDGLDLRQVPWRRGRGYDVDALSSGIHQLRRMGPAGGEAGRQSMRTSPAMRCLGFCVSIEHAQFMAQHFNRHGIDAVAIWGDSPRMRPGGRAT